MILFRTVSEHDPPYCLQSLIYDIKVCLQNLVLELGRVDLCLLISRLFTCCITLQAEVAKEVEPSNPY